MLLKTLDKRNIVNLSSSLLVRSEILGQRIKIDNILKIDLASHDLDTTYICFLIINQTNVLFNLLRIKFVLILCDAN